MIVLADAKLMQIAGDACDLLQRLCKGLALATFEGGEDLVRPGPGVAFKRIAQDAYFRRIGPIRNIVSR